MTTKIKYSAVLKNKRRKNAKWYGRIRQDNKEKYICLNTTDSAVANKWVERQEHLLWEVHEFEEAGQPVPDELMALLVTVDRQPLPERAMSAPMDAPGNIIEQWEVDMRVRGFRPGSIQKYVAVPSIVFGKGVRADTITPGSIARAFAGFTNLSDSTRKFYTNALRSLFMFMSRMDLYKAVPRVRVNETADKPFWDEGQMNAICMTVRSDTAERTLQYREYFRVLAATGIRNSAVAALKWKHVSDATVRLPAELSKTRRAYTIPMPYELFAELDVRRGDPEGKVFDLISQAQSVRYRILQRALDKLGLRGGLHTFRRSRSQLIYKKVKDIKVAAAMLGHSPQVALRAYQDEVGVDEIRKAVFDE